MQDQKGSSVKKIIIISDNAELVAYFKQVANEIPTTVAEFNYCYSEINKSPDALKKMDMSIVDMKNNHDIDYIVSNYDLVISVHCKQIFPKNLVDTVRCINIHPGLNPYNRGWFPQVFSIINKKPIGCTIHLMDEEIDHGDVIYQKEITIDSWDTSLEVYNKVVAAEKELIKTHLLELVNEKYIRLNVSDEGNYNEIKDFKNLSQLDLSSIGSLAEHIDLLRALSHDNFNNAFFIDKNGSKIFVKIKLEKE